MLGEAAYHICPSVSSSVLLSVGGIVLYRFFEWEEKGLHKIPIMVEAEKRSVLKCNPVQYNSYRLFSNVWKG